MKKILLTTIALLSMASASVFGMYGPDSDWIFFLTHGNQFRARLDQLGFTLGNDTIKGTFGFRNNSFGHGTFGGMLTAASETETTTTGLPGGKGFFYNFNPTISMGIGYTSSLISVGVGYNATIGDRYNRYNGKTEPKKVEAVAHTPVLVLNALDNAFRMAIPIQVVHLTDDKYEGIGKGSVTAVSLDAQFRYYSGLDVLPQIRLYLRYGMYGYNITPDAGEKTDGKFAESFGFDLRFYFGSMVEEVALQPIVKLAYNGALGKQHNQKRVQAAKLITGTTGANNNNPAALFQGTSTGPGYTACWEQSAWELTLTPALGLTANSDIVSLYFEPSLGLKITQDGDATAKVKEVYGLAYDVYAEIYITPIKNLEWYFEASIGNVGTGDTQNPTTKALSFAGTTGITWYLPAL